MASHSSGWPGLAQAINEMISTGVFASLSDSAKAVWLVLAKRAGRDGRAWPGNNSIAKDAGKGRSTTYRALEELERAGLVQRECTTGGSCHNTTQYQLFTPSETNDSTRPAGGTTHPSQQGDPSRQRDPYPSQQGDTTRPAGGTPPVPAGGPESPSESPKESPSESPKGGVGGKSASPEPSDLPEPLDTPTFREAWAEWKQHRREIRHSLTPTTVKRQLKKLECMGHDTAIASMQQSIEHGWRGLFEVDKGGGGSGGKEKSLTEQFLEASGFQRRDPTPEDIAIAEGAPLELVLKHWNQPYDHEAAAAWEAEQKKLSRAG